MKTGRKKLRQARRNALNGAEAEGRLPFKQGVRQSASHAAIAASDKSLVELALSTWGLLKLRSRDYRLWVIYRSNVFGFVRLTGLQ